MGSPGRDGKRGKSKQCLTPAAEAASAATSVSLGQIKTKDIIMACDVCKKVGTPLIELRDIYKTESIQAVCPECEAVISRHLSKVQRMTVKMLIDLMKRFIRARADKR